MKKLAMMLSTIAIVAAASAPAEARGWGHAAGVTEEAGVQALASALRPVPLRPALPPAATDRMAITARPMGIMEPDPTPITDRAVIIDTIATAIIGRLQARGPERSSGPFPSPTRSRKNAR